MANEKKTTDANFTTIEIGTILSMRTEQGVVEFYIEDENGRIKTQWDINKAREIHGMLGQAIEAAVSDTLIFKFMTEIIKVSKDKAAMALIDFRELRQGSKDTLYPS